MSSDMRFVNDYRNVTSSFTSSLSLYTSSMNYRFLDDTTITVLELFRYKKPNKDA